VINYQHFQMILALMAAGKGAGATVGGDASRTNCIGSLYANSMTCLVEAVRRIQARSINSINQDYKLRIISVIKKK